MAGKQAQITFALPPELLDKVDHMAGSLSISRAAFIKQALTRAVKAENQ
jgi:predicted transcriptional regulator